MHVRWMIIGAVLVVLAVSPLVALAQGRGHRMGPRGSMGHESGSVTQMEGTVQQMGDIMQQMAERIKAGPMTPDQTLQMSEMMEQMAIMMHKMPGMMGGGAGPGGQPSEMPSSDPATPFGDMRQRLTEMQKRMAALMAAPQPVKP